jgi:Gram-negative bacterial TonB protein C-terminal
VSLFRLTKTTWLCAALLAIAALASSALAEMPKPNPEAYDAPPVLIRQDVGQFHQQIVQSAAVARLASESGVLVVSTTVDERGFTSHVTMIRGAAMSLDEKAIESVRRDRFQPALKDGTPVVATIYLKILSDPAVNSGQ